MDIPLDVQLAARGWNLMGGEINWAGLPLVAGLLGVQDIDAFIAGLVGIRTAKSEDE